MIILDVNHGREHQPANISHREMFNFLFVYFYFITTYLKETNAMLQGPGSKLEDWNPGTFHKLFASIVLALVPNHTKIKAADTTRVLYVVNHCLQGLDLPLLFASIYIQTGQWPRGLADRIHFKIPVWSQFLKFLGAVEGSPENFERLANANHSILVFSGGARETLRKRSDEHYTLMWGKRKGFAREAIKHKYDIVPVGSVGLDENFIIIYDLPIDLVLRLIGDKRTEITWPVFVPSFRFQRIYIFAGEAIESKQFHTEWENKELQEKLRDETKAAVEELINACLKFQAVDQNRFIRLPWR